jgi:hypothetical protein
MTVVALTMASSAAAQTTTSVKVPVSAGTFDFVVSAEPREPRNPYGDGVKGTVTNATAIEWASAEFEVKLFKKNGQPITDDIFRRSPTVDVAEKVALRPGATAPVDVFVSGLKAKDVARIEIQLKRAFATRIVKPALTAGTPVVEHRGVEVQFLVTRERLGFSLRNTTDAPIQLDWNTVSYVDQRGTAHRVMHDGVKFSARENPQPPSIIPPGAKVSDVIIPTDYVEYIGRDWHVRPMFGDDLGQSWVPITEGGTFSVLLPLVINGTTENLFVTFKIEHVH